MNHLICDGYNTGSLLNLIRVAVDGRHHRARHSTRDTAIVEAAVLPRICGPSTLPRGGTVRRAFPPLVSDRRHLALRWIAHQPRAAVRREVILEPVHRAGRAGKLAEPRCALDGLLLALFRQRFELGLRKGLELAAGEFLRTLERNAAFVAVVVRARDVGIAPRGSRRLIRAAWRDRGRTLSRRHF